jgi:hypothetical protein
LWSLNKTKQTQQSLITAMRWKICSSSINAILAGLFYFFVLCNLLMVPRPVRRVEMFYCLIKALYSLQYDLIVLSVKVHFKQTTLLGFWVQFTKFIGYDNQLISRKSALWYAIAASCFILPRKRLIMSNKSVVMPL